MPNARIPTLAFVWALLLLATVVGCGGDSSASNAWDIPATTKVVDDSTRAALTSYSSADGTLQFASSTPVLDALAEGDVLVSDVSPAAPQGFLRKVTSIDRTGGGVVVHSTPAALTDAIHGGSLTVAKRLTLDNMQPANLPPGVSLQAGAPPGAIRVLDTGSPPPGGMNLVFNGLNLTISNDTLNKPQPGGMTSGDPTVSGQVTVNGWLHVDPQLLLDLQIGSNPLPYMKHMKVGFELNEQLDVDVTAQLAVGYKFEATYEFVLGAFTIMAGPVPLVFTPVMDLTVGAAGTASVSVTFHAQQGIDTLTGSEYWDGAGWHDISHNNPLPNDLTFDQIPHLQLDVQAYPKVTLAVKLYDLAGPYFEMGFALDANLTVPGNPWLSLSLILQASLGVQVKPFGIPLLDANLPLYNLVIPILTAPPVPPGITIAEPRANASMDVNDTLTLLAIADDLQDGIPNVTWHSDKDGDLGTGPLLVTRIPAHEPGIRTITATATDSAGLSATATTTINVTASTPITRIDSPLASDAIYAGQSYTLTGEVLDSFSANPCTDPAWQISWTSTVPTAAPLTGCTPTAVFMPPGNPTTPVPSTLTFVAKDPWGGQSTPVVVNVSVSPPPPITVNITAPTPSQAFTDQSTTAFPPITLTANATDPAYPGDTLSYTWWAIAQTSHGNVRWDGIGTGPKASWDLKSPTAPAGFIDYALAELVGPQVTGEPITVNVAVTDQHGTPAVQQQVLIYYIYQPN